MPISGQYSWEESQDDIIIYIPFRGKSIKKADLFVADRVLKVSHPPFLLDLNLNKEIQTKTCKAILKDSKLIINLKKISSGLWHKLVYDGKTKEELRKRRTDSIQRREEEIRQQHEDARSKKLEEERMTVQKQMDLNESEYQHIEDLKNKEKQEAEDGLYKSIANWSTDNNKKEVMKEQTIIHSSQKLINVEENEEEKESNEEHDDKKQNHNDEVTNKKEENDEQNNIDESEDIFDCTAISSLPAVRKASCLNFKHTPRVFKTPVRESTVLREKEFLVKNRPYLHKNKYLNNGESTTADVSEVDPTWLKKKGDDFFRGGDYLSAINAYSEAFEKDTTFYQALTNRSLCYLQMGEAERSICDGKEALQIIRDEVSDDLSRLSLSDSISAQKKILTRIATAQCHLGGDGANHFESALKYLQEAAQLDDTSSDETLAKGIERMKVICEAVKLKCKGDAFLADEKIESAINSYKGAALKEDALLSAKVNCATAYLLQGNMEGCASLCGEVLEVLKMTGPCKPNGMPPIGTIPLAGTDQRRKLAAATLYKRAEANMSLGRFDLALQDLEMARKIGNLFEDEANLDCDITEVATRLRAQSCC